MGQLLAWWTLIEVMGLLGLPLAFHVFSARFDHGYGFTKIITLLIVSYVAWIVGHLGVGYTASLAIALSLYVAGNVALFLRSRAEITAWLRAGGGRALLAHDSLWTFGFLLFAWQRSLGPEIMGAEKFMDFAFYNSLARTDVMPPLDPWMSGEVINYYYFGYQMMANLGRIASLPMATSYNLCVATLGALAFSQTTAVGWGLTRSLPFGLLSGAMTTLIGNLDGFLQWVEKGTVIGLDYWRSTRIVGGDSTINEFPYFTIIHGDMHPHFIVLPVAVLLWALLADPGRRRAAPGAVTSWSDVAFYLPVAFALASSVVISPWELPVGAMVTFLLLQRELPFWPLITWARLRVLLLTGGLLVIGYLMYLPFYLHFAAPGGGVGIKFATTSLVEFLIVFGALLAPPALYLAHEVGSSPSLRKEVFQALLATGGLVTVIAYLAGNAVFVVLVALVGGALVAAYRSDDIERRTASLLVLGAVVALLACEIVFIRDAYGDKLYRMNTVFKLYFQAWILLVLAAPWCWQQLLGRVGASVGVRAVSMVTVGALLLASCAYPAGITMTRLAHGGAPRTLDGNDYLRRHHPGDFEAIEWLRANVSGAPVILEATGDPYSYYARYSSNVGLPTVMGWSNHEGLWRQHESAVGSRRTDVIKMYTARSLDEANPLLARYGVKYIVVGEVERKDYPAEGLAKFSGLKVAFEKGDTVIYERE